MKLLLISLPITLAVAPVAWAQRAPVPPTAAEAKGTDRAPATASGTSTASSRADQAVMLNPFEVQEDSDKSYGALNSNSITRFNTELSKMPISADIFDQTFMNDVGVGQLGIEGMIQEFTAGAGFATSDPGGSAASTQSGDRNGNSYIQLRGLSAPSMQRDGLMIVGSFLNPGANGVGYSSTFDIDRVEVINGPQALLYGSGGAGGVINTVSKQARLGRAAFGSARFQVDQYGNKRVNLDYGIGNKTMALRLALEQGTVSGRRWNIGGPFEGYYGQLAFKPFKNTTIRLTTENTTFDRVNSQGLSLTAASTANDARNGQNLHYLLATNQILAAASGPSGAGPILNGHVNWGNVDSLPGWQAREITMNRYSSLTVDTNWNSWLSTQFAVGYDNYFDDRINNTLTLYAPNNTSNPLGVWAMGETGGSPMSDTTEPSRTKGIRFSALITKDLFHGRAHTQTTLGVDFIRGDQGQITYDYFKADANFNIITGVGPRSTNGGYSIVPRVYWSVDNGPIKYPLWEVAGQKMVTYQGVNYVRAIQNPIDTTLVSPTNPVGVTGSGSHYILQKIINKGIFGANNTSWMDGRLNTLVGFRLADSLENTYQEGAQPFLHAGATAFNFSVGANYRLTPWLRPYFAVSDSINPPPVQSTDPYGAQPVTARARGEEVGVKIQNASGTISGSIAIYHVASKNEEYLITSTFVNEINPSGLNGRVGNSGNWINVPRASEGVQVQLTASPTSNWRMRLSASTINGTVGGTTSYGLYYNDQFYTDRNGNVTYKDGTVVTVNPSANGLLAASAGGAPLTITAMSTAGNRYYANPVAVSGAINTGSAVATVLKTVDPVHGPILTGAVGLPISQIQINPGFTPPPSIVTSRNGDLTVGYPKYSFNYTSVYTFENGWQRGFRLGGTVELGWKRRQFYYFPNGVTPGATRTIFYFPNVANFNLIAGYSKRFRRFTWDTQLNVNNLFNHYHIVITPNATLGWAGPLNATFDQQPRLYTWSSSISF